MRDFYDNFRGEKSGTPTTSVYEPTPPRGVFLCRFSALSLFLNLLFLFIYIVYINMTTYGRHDYILTYI